MANPMLINMAASMSMCVCRKSAKLIGPFYKLMMCETKRTCSFITHGRFSRIALYNSSWLTFHRHMVSNTSDEGSKQQSITESILKQKIGVLPKQEQKDEQKKGRHDQDKTKKKDSIWSAKNVWKLGLLSLGCMGTISFGIMLYEWGAPRLDKDGKEVEDEFTHLPVWQQYPKRAARELNFYKQLIRDPTSEKLLPDPLKEPYYQPPYTLVLEMTGVLVHPDWTYSTGWRFKKRPGVEYFLQQVGPPLFEVVIYTAEQGFTAFPILDSLDPKGYITYRLYRDSTRYLKGHHVKDLSCLNRDLSKVIIVDCNPRSYELQPRNAVGLKKWKGDDDDRTLFDLAQFLRTIATSSVPDVRTVLDYYSQFDDPLEAFRENQRKLQEQEKLAKLQEEQQRQQSLVGSVASGFFRR